MPLHRIAIGSCVALVALLLAAALLYGGGGDAFHIVRTGATPTVDVAGLAAPDLPAASAEVADLDRLAGTSLTLLLLASFTVLATLLGVIAAENLARQGRRVIEVMLGAPPAWLVGAAMRRWSRWIAVALVLGAVLCAAAAFVLEAAAPPGTSFATPAAWPVVLVVVAVALLVLAIGVLPVAALYRRDRPLRQQAESQHNTDPRPRQFGRVVLITLQLCVSVTILTASGLLILPDSSGVVRATSDNGPGSAGGHSVVGLLSPAGDSARDPDLRATLYRAALVALQETPGLTAESLATPGAWIGRGPEVRALNECGRCSTGGMPHPIHATRVKQHVVMPGFFAERGLEFVAGGGFAPGGETPGQVVINEAYARAHFRDPPVIGREVAIGGIGGPSHAVVGVVRDTSRGGLGASGSPYSVYYSALQHPPAQMELVVSVDAAADPVADPEWGLEDSLEVVRGALGFFPMDDLTLDALRAADDEVKRLYGTAGWLGSGGRGAGLIAAVAALAGMIGTLGTHVRARRREMGIRSALGADPRALHRMVLGEALRIGGVGVGMGLWLTTLVVGVLGPPGVRMFSAPLFLLVAVVFVVAAVGAARPSARLAASADPKIVMDAGDRA